MTVIDRPWLYRDDDGKPRFKTSWHDEWQFSGPRWPGPKRKDPFEPHDAQTRKLIERHEELYRLEYGEVVAPLLDEWQWRDRMNTAQEKQGYREPLDPGQHGARRREILASSFSCYWSARERGAPRLGN